MKHATAGSPYRVPPEPNRWPAIGLAVAVHALLLAFLWIGVSWQSNEPVALEAEVWDMSTQEAAPTPPPPQVVEPQPEPEPAPPPKVVEQPPAPQPDIRLEQEKKRKEELRRQQEERELAEKKEREEARKKELAEKKAKEEKLKADKLAKEKAEKAEKVRLEALRKKEMARMMAQAGTGGAGTAARSTAPRLDTAYQAVLASKIKSNTNYAGSTDAPGNPQVEFHIELLPTGEIISVRKIKGSGIAAFDDAVEKGIRKSSPLPKKKDGTVERSFPISFRMKDLE